EVPLHAVDRGDLLERPDPQAVYVRVGPERREVFLPERLPVARLRERHAGERELLEVREELHPEREPRDRVADPAPLEDDVVECEPARLVRGGETGRSRADDEEVENGRRWHRRNLSPGGELGGF